MEEKIYIYCRISTQSQNIQRQIRNGKRLYPNGIVVEEKYTGKTQDRPKWIRLLKQIDKDIENGIKVRVVFDSVSRMSRNKEEGVKQYFELYEKGVELEFIKDGAINTEIYRQAINRSIEKVDDEIANVYIEATNRVLKLIAERQIEQAFLVSESEIKELRARTQEGIETARLNGKQIGGKAGRKLITKKSVECKEQIRKLSKSFEGGLADVDVINRLKMRRATYYKYKKEMKEELSD